MSTRVPINLCDVRNVGAGLDGAADHAPVLHTPAPSKGNAITRRRRCGFIRLDKTGCMARSRQMDLSAMKSTAALTSASDKLAAPPRAGIMPLEPV